MVLKKCGAVEKVPYEQWVEKLKQIKVIDENEIVTPVSQFVPKNTYIADGMPSIVRNLKRISDCILALIAMVFFSPLFVICYCLIKREDGGPAIYKQQRIGRFGRPFYIYKFRSMRLDAEKMGPQLSVATGEVDPRLTKIGRFLRSHHIDELPQLYNVFIGDMSFVGPRPERKYYIDQIMEYDKRYVYLYQIRPGVTSLATLYNGYTDTMAKMLCRLEYDLYYLGHRSWWLDMKLLFKTFYRIVFGKIF
jgi:lipopolysaccharide/colanic/teichoic acid biosynthesis glycosyltransferase